jgi:hypothetical protein
VGLLIRVEELKFFWNHQLRITWQYEVSSKEKIAIYWQVELWISWIESALSAAPTS